MPNNPFSNLIVLCISLLCASVVYAEPSANGAVHAVTGMDHANYHATKNCSSQSFTTTVMTPQPGTVLMPVSVTTPQGVEAFYERAARENVTWLDTVECIRTNKTHQSGTGSTIYSSNWSGYQIGGGSATANHYAQGGWNVPYVSIPPYSPGDNNGYYSSTWVGIGGGFYGNYSTSHPLIQSGTEQDVFSNGSTSYYFWYEVYPQEANHGEYVIPQIPVQPGDSVASVVTWIPESSTAVLGVCNWRTYTCVNFNIPGIGEPSNTTEWIMEATPVYGNIEPIPVFSNIYFNNNCWAATTTYVASKKPGVVSALNDTSGVTGTTSPCEAPIYGPSLSPILLQLFPPYASGYPIISSPGPINSGTNGTDISNSDFTITYQ